MLGVRKQSLILVVCRCSKVLGSSELSTNSKAEVVVIGSGPGGYVAAIRLGQLGKEVKLIEREKLGGVCLNVGCIPSKALITASKLVKNARNASKIGIDAEVKIDYQRLQSWKQGVVDKLVGGISQLCKVNGVEVVQGEAKFLSGNAVEVNSTSGSSVIEFGQAIIATGSSPSELPFLKIDGNRIISSTEALSLSEPPEKLLILGGGVIGLEIGMAYANMFGTELTIVEALDQLLPGTSLEMVAFVSRSLQRLNAKVHLKSKLKSVRPTASGVEAVYDTPEGEITSTADYLLVSIGRRPNVENLQLERLGVEVDPKGFVKVDKKQRTSVPNIFAIGDVAGGPLLAHKASKEGIVAAEVIAGLDSSFDNVVIPTVIFTDPEIAVAGISFISQHATELTIGKFPFSANGRALATLDSEGFVKVSASKESGRIMKVEIVGNEASDLISEAVLAIEMGAGLEDIALTIHSHPTLPEAFMEASENALGKSIHIQNRK